MKPIIDIENLGFDSGAHLLIKLGLEKISGGQEIEIKGHAAEWKTQAAAWCRAQGHAFLQLDNHVVIRKRSEEKERWTPAPTNKNEILSSPSATLGLAARGAQVEIGSPEFQFRLNKKDDVWSDKTADLYQQALNNQWHPEVAIDWSPPQQHENFLEDLI